jgi:DNA replication protein DnaC
MKQITKRESNTLIRSANIMLNDAEIENIDYTSGRILDRQLLEQLAECDFVTEQKNVVITGYVGAGKTYLASALAKEACRRGVETLCVEYLDFIIEMDKAHNAKTSLAFMEKYLKPELLIIDDWLLSSLTDDERMYLFGFLYKRNASTIICSPLDKSAWLKKIGGEDCLMGKEIIYLVTENAYEFNIQSTTPKKPVSMRKIYAEK